MEGWNSKADFEDEETTFFSTELVLPYGINDPD